MISFAPPASTALGLLATISVSDVFWLSVGLLIIVGVALGWRAWVKDEGWGVGQIIVLVFVVLPVTCGGTFAYGMAIKQTINGDDHPPKAAQLKLPFVAGDRVEDVDSRLNHLGFTHVRFVDDNGGDLGATWEGNLDTYESRACRVEPAPGTTVPADSRVRIVVCHTTVRAATTGSASNPASSNDASLSRKYCGEVYDGFSKTDQYDACVDQLTKP